MNILDKIVAQKKIEIEQSKQILSIKQLDQLFSTKYFFTNKEFIKRK